MDAQTKAPTWQLTARGAACPPPQTQLRAPGPAPCPAPRCPQEALHPLGAAFQAGFQPAAPPKWVHGPLRLRSAPSSRQGREARAETAQERGCRLLPAKEKPSCCSSSLLSTRLCCRGGLQNPPPRCRSPFAASQIAAPASPHLRGAPCPAAPAHGARATTN